VPDTWDWAATLQACAGAVAFDAVLCRAPRHANSPAFGRYPSPGAADESATRMAVASFALAGCAGCGDAPEGLVAYDRHTRDRPGELPALAPPPLHETSVRAATRPCHPPQDNSGEGRPGTTRAASFVARCATCLRDRYCARCHRWWCEDCLPAAAVAAGAGADPLVLDDLVAAGFADPAAPISALGSDAATAIADAAAAAAAAAAAGLSLPKAKTLISKSCWECGHNCFDCLERTQRICKGCCTAYCMIHNEGSTKTLCDWCAHRGRRGRCWRGRL